MSLTLKLPEKSVLSAANDEQLRVCMRGHCTPRFCGIVKRPSMINICLEQSLSGLSGQQENQSSDLPLSRGSNLISAGSS